MNNAARVVCALILLGVGVWAFDKLSGNVLGTIKRNLP